ncbi:MAG: hypothetical protein ABIS01_04845 [Ferruginibacter sp.]
MESPAVQQLFFQHLRGKLPAHISLVDELAEFLNISNDSAYRRIRGEKSVSFDELKKLCTRYKISLDSFLHLQSDSFIFNGKLKSDVENSFEDWLDSVLGLLQMFNSYEKKHLYYLMKDIPPYVHFLMPELARFKFFFWMKSILHYKSLIGVKFALDDPRYDKFDIIVKKIIELYLKIPMTEIWNIESIESTLRQIAFYRDAGSFKNPLDVKLLYTKVEEIINHLEKQAENGLKFNIGQEPTAAASEYRMYVNELILGDNTILVELDGTHITFLNYGVLFVAHTTDERFNNAMKENLDNLIKKSMMISKSGERERVRFFNRLREKIYQYRD